jgi:hypothetical protein
MHCVDGAIENQSRKTRRSARGIIGSLGIPTMILDSSRTSYMMSYQIVAKPVNNEAPPFSLHRHYRFNPLLINIIYYFIVFF